MINYDKLNPEQKVIADKWEEERKVRQVLLDQLEDGTITFKQFVDKIEEISPSHCEHGRHIYKVCDACEEIERIIRPDLFTEEE